MATAQQLKALLQSYGEADGEMFLKPQFFGALPQGSVLGGGYAVTLH